MSGNTTYCDQASLSPIPFLTYSLKGKMSKRDIVWMTSRSNAGYRYQKSSGSRAVDDSSFCNLRLAECVTE
jgi:hypothetical protein